MSCVGESLNERNQYAVVAVKDGVVVRLLSKAVSRIRSLLLRRAEVAELHVLQVRVLFLN